MDSDLGKGPLGILPSGDVLFEDRILQVGRDIEDPDAYEIDGRGKIVLPGFVDTHNHLWQSLIRGCAGDEPLGGWMRKCVLPGLWLGEARAYAGVRLSTLDLLGSGVTTVVDWSHSFTPSFTEGNLRALSDSGMRFVYGYFLYLPLVQEGDLRRKKADYIDPNPLASMHVCAHPARLPGGVVRRAAEIAHEFGLPLNVHLLETAGDVSSDPIGVLRKAGAFDGTVVANHVVHATDAQIGFLARQAVSVTYNPQSNMRLASGVMPFESFYRHRMKIGLGLDGGANDTSDMFASMRTALGLQRVTRQDADAHPQVADVIHMATLGGAHALRMEDQIGSVTPGKRADIIILDPNRVNFAPVQHVAAQIVFNGQPTNVDWVFVDGRPLKANGELVVEDTTVEEIVKNAQSAAEGPFAFTPADGSEARRGALERSLELAP